MQRQVSPTMMWGMWGLASFFYTYQYIIRVLPNILMTELLDKFQIDAALFGQFSGLYYLGYAGMHVPVGMLLDKYGPKWVLPLCIIITAMGLLPMLYAEQWIYPSLGRVLIGMGSSAAILGVFKVIHLLFPEQKFTFMLGLSVMLGLFGAIYGGQPVNYLVESYGSEPVIKGLVLLGLITALLTGLLMPKSAPDKPQYRWWQALVTVLSNTKILAICFLAGLMVGPLEGFADVWGKAYLKSVYGLSDATAAALPSMIFLGMCFGSPVLSWFTAKTNAYYGCLIASAVVMGGAFIWLLSGALPIPLLGIVFAAVGLFCAYQILAIYLASTCVDTHLVGLTTACANMIIMIYGYFFHSSIGKLMQIFSSGEQIGGVPVYDAQAYTYALAIIPAGLLLGGLGFLVMRALSLPLSR